MGSVENFGVEDIFLPSIPAYVLESSQLLRLGNVKRLPSTSRTDSAGLLLSQTQAYDLGSVVQRYAH